MMIRILFFIALSVFISACEPTPNETRNQVSENNRASTLPNYVMATDEEQYSRCEKAVEYLNNINKDWKIEFVRFTEGTENDQVKSFRLNSSDNLICLMDSSYDSYGYFVIAIAKNCSYSGEFCSIIRSAQTVKHGIVYP